MNELLQKHGCSNVFTVPEGLKELMSDISREVLREQPTKLCDFIANYLSVLLITREHGILAVKILDDLCDCRPSVSEHLLQIGLPRNEAEVLAQVIKEEVEGFEPEEGKEKVREADIVKKILKRIPLDEDTVAKVCKIARNAYRDYWYRKKLLEQSLKVQPDEPWEIAAQHTLELYKKTKPSFSELSRATQKIQAAYKGYHVRRNLLRHLKPKAMKAKPKVELPGPPLDVAESREIDLGRVIDIKVRDDYVGVMFEEQASDKLGLKYDPMRTITHVEDEKEEYDDDVMSPTSRTSRLQSRMMSTKSMAGRSQMMPSATSTTSRPQMPTATSTTSRTQAPRPSAKNMATHVPSTISPKMSTTARSGAELGPKESRISDKHDSQVSFAGDQSPSGSRDRSDDDGEPPAQEVQEVYDDSDAPDGEPEVPEDIPDDRTDGDDSQVTSGPVTADDVTDVEDIADTGVSGDEEG